MRGRTVGLIILMLALAACSGGSKTHIVGTLLLTDTSGNYEKSATCHQGHGPYSDISQGADVTVKDQKGSVIAEGQLEVGKTVSWKQCSFPFSVDAPSAKFYTVEVSHRGGITKPRSGSTVSFAMQIGS